MRLFVAAAFGTVFQHFKTAAKTSDTKNTDIYHLHNNALPHKE